MTGQRSIPSSSRFPFSLWRRAWLVAAMFGITVLTAVTIAAQGATIAGTVENPLGGGVAGATVTLSRDGVKVSDTKTDAAGRFTFSVAQSGRYQVDVAASGFLTRVTDSFYVGADAHPTLTVPLSIGITQAVTVTASANEVPTSQVAAPVTVVDRSIIDALDQPAVAEVLRVVPGAHVAMTGAPGGTAGIYLRGGGSNFNKVLIDGVPANDIGGAFDLQDLSTTGVERIEVLRGANSVLYGSDALSGVVSLTTQRGRTRVPELTYSAEGGNFATARNQVTFGGTAKRFDYFAAFSQFNTDNEVANNDYRNRTFAGQLGWAASAGTDVTAVVRATAGRYGSPNATGFFGIPDDSRRTADDTYVSVTAQSRLTSRLRSTVRLAVIDHNYQTVNPTPTGEAFDPFGFGANYLGNTVTIRGANGHAVTGQAIMDFGPPPDFPQVFDAATTRRSVFGQLTFDANAALAVSAGVRAEHESGSTQFTGSTTSETARNNWGAFLEVRATHGRLAANAGVGVDRNAVFGTAVTPRVSVAAYLREPSTTGVLGDTKVIFNVGQGIKAPAISQELSSLYGVLQGAGVATGSVTPVGPELSRGLDVGIEQGLWQGRVRARAAFFDNTFTDLIEFLNESALTKFGVPADVAATAGSSSAFGAYVNSSSYDAKGVELSFDASVRHLNIAGSYTFVNAVVTKSFASSALGPSFNPAFPNVPIGAYSAIVGARPFRRPTHSGNVLARYSQGRAQVAVNAYFAGKQDDSTFLSDKFFDTSMLLPNHDMDAAFAKVDLSGSYRLHSRLRWFVSVENLLDKNYQAAAGFPALSRALRTGVRVTVGGDR